MPSLAGGWEQVFQLWGEETRWLDVGRALAVECLVIRLCPLGVFFPLSWLVFGTILVFFLLSKGCVYNLRKEKCKVV